MIFGVPELDAPEEPDAAEAMARRRQGECDVSHHEREKLKNRRGSREIRSRFHGIIFIADEVILPITHA